MTSFFPSVDNVPQENKSMAALMRKWDGTPEHKILREIVKRATWTPSKEPFALSRMNMPSLRMDGNILIINEKKRIAIPSLKKWHEMIDEFVACHKD